MVFFPFLSLRRQLHRTNQPVVPGESPSECDYNLDDNDDNDLSYEDALLDSQLRLFLKVEYSHVEPRTGVFRKVLRAIEDASRPRAGKAAWANTLPLNTLPLKNFTAAFRRVLTGQTTMRVLPSGFALVLALSIGLVTNTNRILSTNPSSPQQANFTAPMAQAGQTGAGGQTMLTSPQASYPATQDTFTHPSGSTYGMIEVDPYELRIPGRRGSDNAQGTPEYADDRSKYERKNFNPQ